MDPRLLGILQGLLQEFTKLNETLYIINKRLDKLDINTNISLGKLTDTLQKAVEPPKFEGE
jgi:hypothetical protein